MAHYILSLIGNLTDAKQEQIVKEALKAAECHFPQVEDWGEYEERIKVLLDCEPIKKFFYCEGADVFTEKEMVDMFGRTRRCDRLIILEGEIWVVDYKATPERQEEYITQVEEYKQMLSHIYPDRTIKGFLIYLDRFEVEEV